MFALRSVALLSLASFLALPQLALSNPYTFASASLSAYQSLLRIHSAQETAHAARLTPEDLMALAPAACRTESTCGTYAQLEVNCMKEKTLEMCENQFCATTALDSVTSCYNCLLLNTNVTISSPEYNRVQSQLSVLQAGCTYDLTKTPPSFKLRLLPLSSAGTALAGHQSAAVVLTGSVVASSAGKKPLSSVAVFSTAAGLAVSVIFAAL